LFPEETIKAGCEQATDTCSSNNSIGWEPPPPPKVKAGLFTIDGVSRFALVHEYPQTRAGQPPSFHLFHTFDSINDWFEFERSVQIASNVGHRTR
jgi:hypothetical protein